jgi:CBS domain-containing protein
MTIPYKDRLISTGSSIIDALETLNKLGSEPIAFVVNQDQKLIGSLTDGDIRRALLKGIDMHDKVDQIIPKLPDAFRGIFQNTIKRTLGVDQLPPGHL